VSTKEQVDPKSDRPRCAGMEHIAMGEHHVAWVVATLHSTIASRGLETCTGHPDEGNEGSLSMCRDVVATLRAYLSYPIDAILTWLILVRRLAPVVEMSTTALIASACLAQKIACDDSMFTAHFGTGIGFSPVALMKAEGALFGMLIDGSVSESCFVSSSDVEDMYSHMVAYVHHNTEVTRSYAMLCRGRSHSNEENDARRDQNIDTKLVYEDSQVRAPPCKPHGFSPIRGGKSWWSLWRPTVVTTTIHQAQRRRVVDSPPPPPVVPLPPLPPLPLPPPILSSPSSSHLQPFPQPLKTRGGGMIRSASYKSSLPGRVAVHRQKPGLYEHTHDEGLGDNHTPQRGRSSRQSGRSHTMLYHRTKLIGSPKTSSSYTNVLTEAY
jgi:hypothetical protein